MTHHEEREGREEESYGFLSWFEFFVLFALFVVSMGCNTATPAQVKARQPSFDGGIQNSGFAGWSTNAAKQVSGILTSHARDRYNALILAYGRRFSPPLLLDAGLTPETNGQWLIDAEHLVTFETMNRWKKESGQPPP